MIRLFFIICVVFFSIGGFAQGKITRPTKKVQQQSSKTVQSVNNQQQLQQFQQGQRSQPQNPPSSSPEYRLLKVNSSILESSYHKWWVTSIELNSVVTIVSKKVAPKVAESWVYETKDEYIEDCDTGKRYYITASSLGMEPNKRTLHSTEVISFEGIYPVLPSSVKRINIGSNMGIYVRNLQIR